MWLHDIKTLDKRTDFCVLNKCFEEEGMYKKNSKQ